MASEMGAMFVTLGRQDTRGDTDYIRRRRLGGERIYATTPGKSVPIFADDFDLSHLEWQDDGNCRGTDPEVFFPSHGEGISSTVRAVCDACPVQQTCLDYALERPQLQGVWGGLTDEERNKIRKERGVEDDKAPRRRHHAAP